MSAGDGLVWLEDADGDRVAFDPDTGAPVGGVYADGRGEFDASGYPSLEQIGYYDEPEPEPAYDPQAAELAGRLDELSARLDRANERALSEIYVPTPRSAEAIEADMRNQAQHLEGMLGRRLTDRERHAVASRAIQNLEAAGGGERPDLLYAAAQLGDEGSPALHNLQADTPSARHDARVGFMTELVEDANRRERGEEFGAPPPRRAEMYDMNPDAADRGHGARTAKMADHLAGYDVTNRDYNSAEEMD